MSNSSLKTILAMVCITAMVPSQAQEVEELQTLFTTPAERQIINANRYKGENKPVRVQREAPEPTAVRELIKEEVTQSFAISGISINIDGSRIAWINNQAYENGATMEDGSKLRINNGPVKTVSITTPDGKQHTGTSGETIDVSYLKAADQ